VTYVFSQKMSRLIIFMGPTAACLGGVAVGYCVDFFLLQPLITMPENPILRPPAKGRAKWFLQCIPARAVRLFLGYLLIQQYWPMWKDFESNSKGMAPGLSHPQLMTKFNNGHIMDDYRESYWWLRSNTPEDARVMAWWDYGYQIAGMANRTTIADGNTWSQEHIALLGMCLSSPIEEAHLLIRHLADYILVWTGGGSDDLGKSAHMARIANSIYEGHCNSGDCDQYGVFPTGVPAPMMDNSMMWWLQGRNGNSGKTFVNTDRFEEVYVSTNGKVRIVKVLGVDESSKKWGADPGNRLCDAVGSWYCPGQYSPALRDMILPGPAPGTNPEAKQYKALYAARMQTQIQQLPKANGPGIPEGSYTGSCAGCSIELNNVNDKPVKTLVCTHCRVPGSPASPGTLDMSTCINRHVNNIHGELQCQPDPNTPDVPKGPYEGSCQGCRLEGKDTKRRVECSHCGRANGKQRKANYFLHRCPSPAYLDNQDGILTCLGIGNADGIPPGGYKDSCQGCSMKGTELQCSHCRAANGKQLSSKVTMANCKGAPDNNNGRLVC